MSKSRRMEIIWGTAILDRGASYIPNLLIRNYRKLGISHGEWGLITNLISYKHDAADPFPSEETLAENLDCTERQIRKWIRSLKQKELILVGRRRNVHNKRWDNNVYSFKPLIDKCLELCGEEPLPETKDFDIEWENGTPPEPEVPVDPEEPQVPMGSEPQVPLDPEPEVPPNIDDDDEYKNIYTYLILFEKMAEEYQMPSYEMKAIREKLLKERLVTNRLVLQQTMDEIMQRYRDPNYQISSLSGLFIKALQNNHMRQEHIKKIKSQKEEKVDFPFYNWLEEE